MISESQNTYILTEKIKEFKVINFFYHLLLLLHIINIYFFITATIYLFLHNVKFMSYDLFVLNNVDVDPFILSYLFF